MATPFSAVHITLSLSYVSSFKACVRGLLDKCFIHLALAWPGADVDDNVNDVLVVIVVAVETGVVVAVDVVMLGGVSVVFSATATVL